MRLTKKCKDYGYCIKSSGLVGEEVNKLAEYEDIDENPKHLSKVKQALGIIKLRLVDMYRLKTTQTLEDYNYNAPILTQEEYDLLKEVFNCGK